MKDGNYLNIPKPERRRFIYRIISVERLLELFETKQNVLVKPSKWNDPFENFILRSRVRLPTGEYARFEFHDKFYGQCWTLHRASDAMWQIYSPQSDAVRIRTTIGRLANSLWVALEKWAHIQAFIGKVRYLPDKKLISFAKNMFRDIDIPQSAHFAQTLLVKRPAFKHEREVRLIHFQHDDTKSRDDIYRYDVNPHELIDQIMIDPRMPVQDANDLKKKIRSSTGFKGEIKRSLLYAPPPELVLSFGKPKI